MLLNFFYFHFKNFYKLAIECESWLELPKSLESHKTKRLQRVGKVGRKCPSNLWLAVRKNTPLIGSLWM